MCWTLKERWKSALIFMIGKDRFNQCNFETEYNKFKPEFADFTHQPEEETKAFKNMINFGNLNINPIE